MYVKPEKNKRGKNIRKANSTKADTKVRRGKINYVM